MIRVRSVNCSSGSPASRRENIAGGSPAHRERVQPAWAGLSPSVMSASARDGSGNPSHGCSGGRDRVPMCPAGIFARTVGRTPRPAADRRAAHRVSRAAFRHVPEQWRVRSHRRVRTSLLKGMSRDPLGMIFRMAFAVTGNSMTAGGLSSNLQSVAKSHLSSLRQVESEKRKRGCTLPPEYGFQDIMINKSASPPIDVTCPASPGTTKRVMEENWFCCIIFT